MSRTRLIALLLVLGTLGIYFPVSHYGFTLYDDTEYVSENSVVQDGLTWAGIKWAFTTFHASNWHPVTWLSHELDCQLFGPNAPGMFHLVNVLLHAANVILVLALLLRLGIAFWPSAFVAALFAWHPLHVESVAWISERKDVLSTLFALLSLLVYAKYAKENRRRDLWLALFFFALGLMSKPMLVTLPFVMLLLDFWPLNRIQAAESKIQNFSKLLVEKIPFLALVVASCVVTFIAQHRGGAVVSLENVSLTYRFENAPVAAMRYLLKMIWPEHQAVFYPREKLSRIIVAASALLLILISAAVWSARKKSPYWLVGWLWFLGTLVPVIGLVSVGGAAMADRYTYFPSIGIFLALAMGICDAIPRFHLSKFFVAVAAATAIAACFWLTHWQIYFWRDDVTLFSRAIAVTKDNDVARLNLGYALEKVGRKTEAMEQYRIALKSSPHWAEPHINFANLLDGAGQRDEALKEYLTALKMDPKNVAGHNNLGAFYVEGGNYDKALRQYAESIRLDSSDWHAPFLTGKALLRENRDEEAIPFFKQAIQNAPNNPETLLFVAKVLASDDNPKIRDGKMALTFAQKADALTGGVQPAMIDALALAYAELGDFNDATNAAKDALDLANHFNMTNDAPLIEKHLELFKNGQPFRQSFTNAPVQKSLKE